jgi:hypothetical protein
LSPKQADPDCEDSKACWAGVGANQICTLRTPYYWIKKRIVLCLEPKTKVLATCHSHHVALDPDSSKVGSARQAHKIKQFTSTMTYTTSHTDQHQHPRQTSIQDKLSRTHCTAAATHSTLKDPEPTDQPTRRTSQPEHLSRDQQATQNAQAANSEIMKSSRGRPGDIIKQESNDNIDSSNIR